MTPRNEQSSCFDSCPRLKPFKNSGVLADNLVPVKIRYTDRDGMPIDFRDYWELQSIVSSTRTSYLAKTEQGAVDFREGTKVCPSAKEVKLGPVTLFRKCQNPDKPKLQ